MRWWAGGITAIAVGCVAAGWLVACSSSDDQAPPDGQVRGLDCPEATTLIAPRSATVPADAAVTVLAPGGPDVRTLRFRLRAGEREELVIGTTGVVEQSEDGNSRSIALPTMQMPMVMVLTGVAAGQGRVTTTIGDVTVNGGPAPAQLSGVRGATAEGTVDELGNSTITRVFGNSTITRVSRQMQELNSFAQVDFSSLIGVPLPERPVGPGARWTAARTFRLLGGLEQTTTSKFTLTRMDLTGITLDITARISGAGGCATVEGTTVRVDPYGGELRGQCAYDLSRPLASACRLSATVDQRMSIEDPGSGLVDQLRQSSRIDTSIRTR